MTVPRKNRTKQPKNSLAGPDIALTFSANDDALVPGVNPRGPDRCPTCGRPYFGPAASGLLDLVVLTQEHLGTIKAVLETVVIP